MVLILDLCRKALILIMKVPVLGLSDGTDSNNFLRSLWAEMRSRFGKCAWNYQPFKEGPSNTIFLGWADINQNQAIPISLTYKQRSILNGVLFGEQFDPQIDATSILGQKLKDAVNVALKTRRSPKRFSLQTSVATLRFPVAPYVGDWFAIKPSRTSNFLITLTVKAYDQEDAKTEFLRAIPNVLDILAVETNHLFWLVSTHESRNTNREAFWPRFWSWLRLLLNVPEEEKESICPPQNTFVADEGWIDDLPTQNGYLLISAAGRMLIDKVIAKDELTDAEEIFTRACHHFHVAREQDALVSDRLFFAGTRMHKEGSAELFIQKNPRLTMAAELSKRAEELATVLYMSAVEVASVLGTPKPDTCATCGQEQYRISARVVNYVKEHMPKGGRDHMASIFKTHYNKRSKYLHAGIVLTNRAYTGTTIPILDSTSDSGMTQLSTVLVINLREWIGYMLRQQLKTL
jgi:hypothetical protein